MRVCVSTSIAKGFDVFMRNLNKFKFNSIELRAEHLNDQNLQLLEFFSKRIGIAGVEGELKNYNYLLFLGQSLNVDFVNVQLTSRKELPKLRKMVDKAAVLGQRVAVVNNPSEVGYPSKAKEMKHIAESTGAYILLDTAHARTESSSLINFVNYLAGSIVAIRISDFFQGYGHLPIGAGDTKYLNPVIERFGKSDTPFIINLNERYSLIDAWISKTNLQELRKEHGKR
jgi:sugar phosphate isomerase/epimerase